ncbi:Uncharacterized protein dnl_63060 [Desulfonema limicola]|uniref:Uncharacterized protein n=1 Tax=Desulfonema limicola TaxID=45656 RepID=A0A975BEF7_9BACT|nr:hypothetical protein [Desulfonema limicola]QTA83882.1 Uncharacterized protein dnl_63060 [Desulfonema limicola]
MSNNSEFEGMGGFAALLFGVILVIWVMLKDSDRKLKVQEQQKMAAQQQTAVSQFKREFGTNQKFDSSDFYIANKVVDYAKAGSDKLETIANVAGLLGSVKSTIAKESSQATAKLIKEQLESNRQNMITPPQPQQPVYLEPPPRDPRRLYDDYPRERYNDHEYRPRRDFYNY